MLDWVAPGTSSRAAKYRISSAEPDASKTGECWTQRGRVTLYTKNRMIYAESRL